MTDTEIERLKSENAKLKEQINAIPWKACNTVADAHEAAVWQVLKYGQIVTTQDNQRTIELDDTLCIKVRNPLSEPRISPLFEFTPAMMEAYLPQILEVIPGNLGFEYLYSTRMKDFFVPWCKTQMNGEETLEWRGNGDGNGINQIDLIVEALKETESRRAVAVLWSPNHDPTTKNPPCLNHVQFLIRKDPLYPTLPARLKMRVLFRSHDIRGAYGANLYGLSELQKEVAAAVGRQVGHMTIMSNSAHVYLDAQHNDVIRWKEALELKHGEKLKWVT
jgi:thymidylate synthase (methanogen type)